MVTFDRKKNFLDFSGLQSFLYQNFTTNAAKIRNCQFWANLNKFSVFVIFEDINEISSGHDWNVNFSQSLLKSLIFLVLKIISNCT